MASILYVVSVGLTGWMEHFGMVFFFTILAVLIPCCISDIVFPLLFCGATNHKDHCPPAHEDPGVAG
jgi:hypothetical protein